MNLQRNYYEVLGVSADATEQEIKAKYRDLARKFHPDLVNDKALGVKVFSQVNKAYHVLRDTERRRQYDEQQLGDKLQARGGRPGSSNGQSPNGYIKDGTGSSRAATNTSQPRQQVAAPNTVTLSASQSATLDRSLNLANSAIMEGQFDQARQLCEQILRIDGRNARAMGILGDAYSSLNRNESAIKAYRAALDISPSPMVEAKLRRLQEAAAKAKAEPTKQNGSAPVETKPSGGLFSKLMGRK